MRKFNIGNRPSKTSQYNHWWALKKIENQMEDLLKRYKIFWGFFLDYFQRLFFFGAAP